jgi:hypothetical protein
MFSIAVRSDDELLDLAIEVSLEWGPQMSRPVIDRIVERAPEVSRERAAELEARARAITSDGFALAERAYHGEMSYDDGRAELGKRYPRIASTVLDHIWYQGGYYAWHG